MTSTGWWSVVRNSGAPGITIGCGGLAAWRRETTSDGKMHLENTDTTQLTREEKKKKKKKNVTMKTK